MEESLKTKDQLIEEVKELHRQLSEMEIVDEAKLHTITSASPDAIVMLDNDGKVLFWNPSAERLFLYTKAEALGTSLVDLIIPDRYLDKLKRGLSDFSMTGEGPFVGKTVEMVAKRKDGSEFPILHSVSAVRTGKGWNAVGIIHDITKQKKIEVALIESEGRYRDLYENSPLGYLSLDAEGCFVDVNPSLCWMLGYSRAELIGKSFVDFLIKKDRKRFKEGFSSFIEKGETHVVPFEMVRNDGSALMIELSGRVGYDENGNFKDTHCVITDLTDRIRAEKEAFNEAETTRNLLRLSETTIRTDDLDELMESVVEIARDIIRVDIVLSYLWDRGTNTFRPDKTAGLAHGMLPIFKTTPIGLESAVIKGAMDFGEIYMDSGGSGTEPLKVQQDGLWDWVEGVRAISILPLVAKKEYLGFIVCICFLDSGEGCKCLMDREKALMKAVGNQISIALEEARHYKESVTKAMELSQKVETIETMSEISKSILSTLDVHEIIEVTARMVSRLVTCDWVRVIEVDKLREEFNFIAGFEEGRDLENKIIPFSSTSLTEVVDTKRPQYIADLASVNSPLDIERELMKQGYHSVLRIPITVKGEVTGVLGLMSKRISAFGPEDLSTIDKLSDQVGVALENARLVTNLEEFSVGAVRALAETIDAKSPWTRGHSERVTDIALRIGREIGLSDEELKDFKIAGLLHDIGKIGTDESILDKPGKLTKEEFSEIQKHPGKGAEILAPIKQLTDMLPTIRWHHEFFDGTGYPDGLKGSDIPFQARILAVADSVDAMGANRPYRKGMPQKEIVEEIKRCSGTQFDPDVVEAYLKTLESD